VKDVVLVSLMIQAYLRFAHWEVIVMKKIDELNNMSLIDLKKLEDEIWSYYLKIKSVRKFTEECEKED
jgi:hypothetical protein